MNINPNDIITEVKLESLTENGVIVVTNKYINIEGNKTKLGNSQYDSFMNDERGRELIQELGEPYISTILTMWDNIPTEETEDSEETL